jgi:hypothetical protein
MFGFTEIEEPEASSALAIREQPQAWHRDALSAFHPALAQEEFDDPETKIHAIREWALSLHTRRRDNHVSSSSAVMPTLPPLPDIKEYKPQVSGPQSGSRPGTSRSATRPGKKPQQHGPVQRHELLGEYAVVQIMKAQGADEFNPVKPPKSSALGVVIPRNTGKPVVSAPSSLVRSDDGTGIDFSARSNQPRGRPMKVVNLAHFGGQGVVRGFDPMGGTLFGLDAKLDQGTKKHGIYESGLKRQASPGRGTQLPLDTQPRMPLPMQHATSPAAARLTYTGPTL